MNSFWTKGSKAAGSRLPRARPSILSPTCSGESRIAWIAGSTARTLIGISVPSHLFSSRMGLVARCNAITAVSTVPRDSKMAVRVDGPRLTPAAFSFASIINAQSLCEVSTLRANDMTAK